jgi:hypothetical protein
VNIAYYTAEADYYSHKLQVKLAQINPTAETISGTTIIAPSPDDPAADPVLGDTFFGDYIGVASVSHRAYLGFTHNVYSPLYSGLNHAEQNNHVARFDY